MTGAPRSRRKRFTCSSSSLRIMTMMATSSSGRARRFLRIRWRRLYGLALDCAQRHVLGEHVEIRITAADETNTRIRPAEIVDQIRNGGGRGLVAPGRRADQSISARDGHRPASARRGHRGLHRRLPCQRLHRDAAGGAAGASGSDGSRRHAVRGRSGGATRRFAACRVSQRVAAALQLHERSTGLAGAAVPYLPRDVVRRTSGTRTSFDAGRGCPFPVQLLHDHQRPGPEIALAQRRRRRAARARQSRPGRA